MGLILGGISKQLFFDTTSMSEIANEYIFIIKAEGSTKFRMFYNNVTANA